LKNNDCVPSCQFPCLGCAINSPSNCTSCFGAYLLVGSTCLPDFSCNTDKSCSVCPNGFILSVNECIKCLTTDSNCIQCDNIDIHQCVVCKFGFFLDAELKTCNACPSICTSCLSNITCQGCVSGYTLPADSTESTCIPCQSPCANCSSSATNCLGCV
jgi:hypothetical protein